ncbi:YceI family protein [Edaphobacter albus]|uniref:YceI family protein n=1 Tax=Edaphobacter sp. 4G125 TaxID=2763071 RepID=UPI00164736AA|nr:YceI family protein [Edaphobacter sp. 4G125]QNI37914.1 YceI family protein [Edaphobacter sp. 4G125]
MQQPIKTMIRKIEVLVVQSMFLLLFVGTASAQTDRQISIHLDPAATNVRWTLGDVLHVVHGTFKLKQGVISYNPLTKEASGLIEVDATSGESGNSARDHRMHKDVLNSAQYGVITFRPNRVEGTFDPTVRGDFVVDGILNLHGQNHPMKIKVSAQPKGGDGLSIETHFAVPYVEWGLKDPSTFVLRVSKEVSIDIDSAATITNESGARTQP